MSRHLKTHPLYRAHSATFPASGAVVYVVCGWNGCEQRLKVPKSEWALEVLRRQQEGELVAYIRHAQQVD